jgi:hypothetical protein
VLETTSGRPDPQWSDLAEKRYVTPASVRCTVRHEVALAVLDGATRFTK